LINTSFCTFSATSEFLSLEWTNQNVEKILSDAALDDAIANNLIAISCSILCRQLAVRVLADLTRARAVRKAYTIIEARMAYRMIV
jgi:hypothetical protein